MTENPITSTNQSGLDICEMCHKSFGKHPTKNITYKKYDVRGHLLCQFCQPFLQNPACCRTCFQTTPSSTEFFRYHLRFYKEHDQPPWKECPLCHLNWNKFPENNVPIISDTPYTKRLLLPEIYTNTRAQDYHVRNCVITYLIHPASFPIIPEQFRKDFPYLVNNPERVFQNLRMDESVLRNIRINTEQYSYQSHRNSMNRKRRLSEERALVPYQPAHKLQKKDPFDFSELSKELERSELPS